MGKRTRRDLRHLHTHHKDNPWLDSCLAGSTSASMSKEEALRLVVDSLRNLNTLNSDDEKKVTGLISLFSITAEDLLEADVDYETVRATQGRFFITDD